MDSRDKCPYCGSSDLGKEFVSKPDGWYVRCLHCGQLVKVKER